MKKFNCLCCGDCCSGNMEIKLNPHDLYKMAKYLKFNNTKELFDKNYVTTIIGQNGIIIPKIVFKTNPYKFCPFLINDLNEDMILKGYCSLHPYIKPLVCILAPISKEYENKNSIYSFTKPTDSCPGKLIGEDLPIKQLLDPIKEEIELENIFYDILDTISKKNIIDYTKNLYYFDVNDSFTNILKQIRSFYEKA